jgi:D-alanine-D-alanine ligase
MRIGITFDLKTEPPAADALGRRLPDDLHEEFDSPGTIEAIAAVLRGLGHEVQMLGDGRELLEQLLADPPDFVFNIAEGQGISRSREARVPAVLEMLGIPYSGSDPLTLAATLDKDCTRRLAASAGILVPAGFVLEHHEALTAANSLLSGLHYPLIVKPAWEGSSKGIRYRSVVGSWAELAEVVDAVRQDYQQPILVEEFIEGDELTVGVVGNDPPRIVGIMRVLPVQQGGRFVYGLEVKRDFRRLVRYECPAQLSATTTTAVEEAALRAFNALRCRDVARIDFRLRDGRPYFLEINPLPGLNPESSDLVILAELVGWTYTQLIQNILDAALARQTGATAANLRSVMT